MNYRLSTFFNELLQVVLVRGDAFPYFELTKCFLALVHVLVTYHSNIQPNSRGFLYLYTKKSANNSLTFV